MSRLIGLYVVVAFVDILDAYLLRLGDLSAVAKGSGTNCNLS